MSERIAYLEAVIGADITAFRRGMRDARNEVGLLSDSMKGLSHVGRTMTFAFTAPIIALGGAAVKTAADFEAAMRNINSIAGMSEGQFKALSDRVLDLGGSIRSGPLGAAQALYTVFSSGFLDTEQAFKIMEAGAKTAEAGLADLTATTQALTSSLLAYGYGAEHAAEFSNILTRTVQLGVGTMDDVTGAFSKILPTARLLGATFGDTGATLAFLTQRGMSFSEASTALTGALKKLIAPTDAMKQMFAELGVATGEELISKFGGLDGALKAIFERVDGNEGKLFKLFNEVRAFKGVATIANNLDLFDRALADFYNNLDSATLDAWNQQMMSFAAQVDLMQAALAKLSITIGQAIIPMLTPIVTGLTAFLNKVSETDPALIKLGIAFAAVVAAAGPLLWVIGSLVSPITLFMGAVAALATAISTNFGGIADTIQNIADKWLPGLEDLKSGVEQFITDVFGEAAPVQEYDLAAQMNLKFDPSSLEVTVEGTIWDTWDKNFRDIMPWDEFNQKVTEQLKEQGLTPLTIPADGITLNLEGVPGVTVEPVAIQTIQDAIAAPVESPTLLDRLGKAVDTLRPKLETALSSMFTGIKQFILTEVFPTFDTLGSDLMSAISGFFEGGVDRASGLATGKNPVYDMVRNFFSGGIGTALDDLGGIIIKNFPKISKAFGDMIANIGDWLATVGVPTIARALGYFIGTIGAIIGEGIARLPELLFGSAKTGDPGLVQKANDFFQQSVAQPFNQGFEDAMQDRNITSGIDKLVTGLAGVIGTIFAGRFLLALLGANVAGTIGGALSKVFSLGGLMGIGKFFVTGAKNIAGLLSTVITAGISAFNWVVAMGGKLIAVFSSIASTIMNGIGTALIAFGVGPIAAALSALLVVGYVLNEDVRNQINELGKNIADTLFGAGFTDQARKSIETALTPVITGVADIIRNIRANAAYAAGDITEQQRNQALGLTPEDIFRNSTQNGLTPMAMRANQGGSAASMFQNLDQLAQSIMPQPQALEAAAAAVDVAPAVDTLSARVADTTATSIRDLLPVTMAAQTQPIQDAIVAPVTGVAIPIEEGLTPTFGEGGTIATMFTTFVSNLSTTLTGMNADTKTNTDKLSGTLGAFAVSAASALLPLYNRLNEITTMMNIVGNFGGVGATTPTIPLPAPTATPPVPHNAHGGPISGPSWVGEYGPEVFVPNSAGRIVPNNMISALVSSKGEQKSINMITINGNLSIEQIIYELRRRGIRLETAWQ